jgi:mono/diheme cytochrome c family protein
MRANRILLLVASLGTLVLLGAAAYRELGASPWRRVQRRYAAALPPDAARDFKVQLRQLYVPALHASDRCISCHLGMAPGEVPVAGSRLFAAHPDVAHEPGDLGCVACHGGQGRATTEADAHGDVPHWPHPMLPRRFEQAGCGGCHTHLAVPRAAALTRGRALLERHDCLSCHELDGRGGTLRPGGAAGVAAPSLSRVGAVGFAPDWYDRHLAAHAAAGDGPWRVAFGPLPDADRAAMEELLASAVGAPRLVEAKAVFHSLGCRGCHKIAGVGGDDGPDLTRVGERDPGQLDFAGVRGEHSLAGWLAEHFRAPAAVVPGSAMPQLGLRDDEIEDLTLYMLSLRRTDRPDALWPKDRVRAERFREREFATDGATLYGTFCASCHGPNGQGMRYPGMAAFPAIGNPDFLALASDRFLTETITHGRPGRRMPAWGEAEGGLRPAEIRAVVAHVRAFGEGIPAPTDAGPARWVAGDAANGARLYADACASCHGPAGEGREGPALANPRFLAAATDTYLVETIRRGRRGTSMPAFGAASPAHRLLADDELGDVVALLRSWEEK